MTQLNIETIKTNISKLVKHDDFVFGLGVAGNTLLATIVLSLLVLTGLVGYYAALGLNFILATIIGFGLLIMDRQHNHRDIPAWTLIMPLVYIYKRGRKGINVKALVIAIVTCYCTDLVLNSQVENAALTNDVKTILTETLPMDSYKKVSVGGYIDTNFFDEARAVTIVWDNGHKEEVAVSLSHEDSTVSIHPMNSVL